MDDLPHEMRRDLALSVYRKPARTFELLRGHSHGYLSEAVRHHRHRCHHCHYLSS